MKKLLILLFLAVPLFVAAQNLQLHYDFGKPENDAAHNFLMGTFELFHPDSLGYTFLFTDVEFNSPTSPKGASLAYFEASRTFNLSWLGNSSILQNTMLHIEYNDGLVIWPDSTNTVGDNLRGSWLAGPEYGLFVGNFSLNTMLLYKYIRGSSAPDAQLTLAWFYPLFNYKVSLSGFLDIWSQDDFYNNPDEKVLVLYTEPQIWYNFNEHLAVGTEIKISKNFVPGSERLEIFPTLGVKWEF